MPNIPLPTNISWQETGPSEAEFQVGPCWKGYGTTLGNALRRVLLSSLEGAAVTAVKIKGVDHEFSTIDGVLEDVVQIILNLKALRLKVHTDEPVKLQLKVKGKVGPVTAADIAKNADVEIIDKDFVIANLTDKKAELDMEMTVEKGLGFVPVEARKNKDNEVGVLAIDATFTPVKNVGMEVEPARVGQDINYDLLKLKVETDGTITPQEAVNKAIQILLDHFNLLLEKSAAAEVSGGKEKKASKKKTSKKKES